MNAVPALWPAGAFGATRDSGAGAGAGAPEAIPDALREALGDVFAGFEAQRQALLEGDAEHVHAATERLEARVARLRQALPRGASWTQAASLPASLRQAAQALRQAAQANAALLLRRAVQTDAVLAHLAQAAPTLERRRLTGTYAPGGTAMAGTPITRSIGQA